MGRDRRPDPLLIEVREILFVSHRKKDQSPDETLDRVFHKNLEMAGVTMPPTTFRNMTIERSTRPIEGMLTLCTRPKTVSLKGRPSKKVRTYFEVPVIVCDLGGAEYLIDGNRRVRYLAELGRTEVQVYLCRIN